jgi:hypothetical protein
VRFNTSHNLSVGFTLHLFFIHPDIIQCHTIPFIYPSKCLSVPKKQNFSDTLKSNDKGTYLLQPEGTSGIYIVAIMQCSSWDQYHEILQASPADSLKTWVTDSLCSRSMVTEEMYALCYVCSQQQNASKTHTQNKLL